VAFFALRFPPPNALFLIKSQPLPSTHTKALSGNFFCFPREIFFFFSELLNLPRSPLSLSLMPLFCHPVRFSPPFVLFQVKMQPKGEYKSFFSGGVLLASHFSLLFFLAVVRDEGWRALFCFNGRPFFLPPEVLYFFKALYFSSLPLAWSRRPTFVLPRPFRPGGGVTKRLFRCASFSPVLDRGAGFFFFSFPFSSSLVLPLPATWFFLRRGLRTVFGPRQITLDPQNFSPLRELVFPRASPNFGVTFRSSPSNF